MILKKLTFKDFHNTLRR